MKSIAILHYTCPPVVGGVEEIVRQQALLFFRHHHHVKVFAGAGSYFSEKIDIEINPLLASRNVDIIKLQEMPTMNREKIDNICSKLVSYFKKALQKVDILIAHNVLTMQFNLPLTKALHRLANKSSLRIISWNHDSPFFYRIIPKGLQDKSWDILKKYNDNIEYITISENRAKEFAHLYGIKKDIPVIPNGIDPIQFFRLGHNTVRLIFEQKLFLADLILVQPSRLHTRKNVELSIRVLRSLHDLGIQAKLLLTGSYDPHEKKNVAYYKKLINLARELKVEKHLIVVTEYIFENGERLTADRVTMRDLYQISDLLFLPSKQEGFGIPLLEAGMIKLSIVCSDIPPFRAIGDGNVCYFSLKDKPGYIAEKILEFLKSCKLHQMYRKVIYDYVWDNIYFKYIQPYFRNKKL
jgi:glycosyltransferase involved in cell wall biosynthesis